MLFAFAKFAFVRGTVVVVVDDDGLVRMGDAFGWILLVLLSLWSQSTSEFSASVDGEIVSRFSVMENVKKKFISFLAKSLRLEHEPPSIYDVC